MTKTIILSALAAVVLLVGGLVLYRLYGIGMTAPEAGGDVTLTNTYWKLMTIDGSAVDIPDNMEREPHMVLHNDGNRVAGFGGCNRMTGTYVLEGESLTFPNGLAMTRMACEQGMDIEKSFGTVFERAATWAVTGDNLMLTDETGAAIATFEQRLME